MKRILFGILAASATALSVSSPAQAHEYWGPAQYNRHDRHERWERRERERERELRRRMFFRARFRADRDRW